MTVSSIFTDLAESLVDGEAIYIYICTRYCY